MIEKLDYKINTIECTYEESVLNCLIMENRKKINEIIDFLNKTKEEE